MREPGDLSKDARDLIRSAAPLDEPEPGAADRVWKGVASKAAAGTAFVAAGASVSVALGTKVAVAALLVAATATATTMLMRGPEQKSRPTPALVAPAPAQAPAAAPPEVAAAPPVVAPELAAETASLARAHAALRDRDARRALSLLNEHERRFPAGSLRPEAMATRVFALCAAGDARTAQTLGARFVRLHPRSPLAAEVKRTCAR